MADWAETRRREWNEMFDRLAERLRILRMEAAVNGIKDAPELIVPRSLCPLSLLKLAANRN